MIIEGFREILPGLWYCEADGTPWSSKKSLGVGKSFTYEGPLKKLEAKNNHGYCIIRFESKCCLWHRLIFEHFKGEIPENMRVDHKNNIRDDNRIENLQLLSNKENCSKCKKSKRNTSGFAGVRGPTPYNKWKAEIMVDGKQKHLGLFSSPELAYECYLQAKIKYHGQESIKPLEAKNE